MDVEFLKHKFEDVGVGVAVQRSYRIGIRHIQLVYMTACAVLLGMVRAGNGFGIAMMVDPAHRNDSYLQVFEWSRTVQGSMLSSFFYGYALVLVPAELYFKKIGGKIVLSAVLLIDGAIYAALPTIAKEGGWPAVSNAQFLLGMTQACFCPAAQSLLEKWLPPHERAVYGPIVYTGVQIGIMISFPVMSIISAEPLGWELVFYSLAMLLVSGTAVWVLLTAGSPDVHPAAGNSEKEFIKESNACFEKKYLHTPWNELLRSQAVWAGTVAHAGTACVFVYFLTELPVYFVYGLKVPLRTSGWLVSCPFLVAWLTYVCVSPTLESIYNIGFISYALSISRYRKLIHFTGGVGAVIGLVCVSQLDPGGSDLAVFLLPTVLALTTVQYCGFVVSLNESYRDMTQNYSGKVLLLSSAVAGVVAANVPLINGAFILGADVSDLSRWRVSMLTLAGVTLTSTLVYLVAGDAERQTWDCLGIGKFTYLNDVNQVELEDLKSREGEDNHKNLI